MPSRRHHHHSPALLPAALLALAALNRCEAFVSIPAQTSRAAAVARLPLLASFSTTREAPPSQPQPQPQQAAPLTPEEAAQRRAELKEALLQSLVQSSAGANNHNNEEDPVLACPVTLQPLKPEVRLAGPFGEVRSLVTPRGEKRYPQTPVFLDLVPAEDRSVDLGAMSFKPMQDLFRSPLTSFLYERGWRVRF